MAGFFTRNDGYVYEGELTNAYAAVEGIKSGLFVELTDTGVKFPTTVIGYTFKVVEVLNKAGKKWARMNVLTAGDTPLFMVEQAVLSNDELDKDGEVVIEIGEPVRMRRPLPNDQIELTLPEGLDVAVNDTLVPVAATGVVAKA